jgi:hypothetical protein
MKTQLIFTFICWSLISFGQSPPDSLLMENIPEWVRPILKKSDLAQKHQILETFNPFYLEADFNGDKQDDIAFFVENKIDHTKGVMIINKGKNLVFIVGCGTPTDMGSSLTWTKRWFVYRNKTLWNNGTNKKASLKSPAIQLIRNDKDSLVIYWTGRKYKTFMQQS